MCFSFELKTTKKNILNHFDASNAFTDEIVEQANAFDFPTMPIVVRKNSENRMGAATWGLIPKWAKNTDIQKFTLNARIETIHEKASFKDVINNRCIIPMTAFFEWQWLDDSGKQKQKFRISSNTELMGAAGLYSVAKLDNQILVTYTILTTQANELMATIHNTKQRMPIILNPNDYENWLAFDDIEKYNFPYEAPLIAQPI